MATCSRISGIARRDLLRAGFGSVILSAAGDTSSYRVVLSREGSENTFTVEGMTDGTLKVLRPGSKP